MESLLGMVICHDEEDIGSFCLFIFSAATVKKDNNYNLENGFK
jgi:hypothetical protein